MGLRDMWLREQPEWLYKALPYIYAASGIATILVLRNTMAVFSGVMLISAGAIVWLMRTSSRRRAREVPRHGPGTQKGRSRSPK